MISGSGGGWRVDEDGGDGGWVLLSGGGGVAVAAALLWVWSAGMDSAVGGSSDRTDHVGRARRSSMLRLGKAWTGREIR